MSTERDELTDIIATNRNEYADKTADRILAAGYRKPRTITTVEALDAVIEDAFEDARYLVVADSRGRPWIIWDDEDGDVQVDSWPQEEDPERLTLSDITLPATVLNAWG